MNSKRIDFLNFMFIIIAIVFISLSSIRITYSSMLLKNYSKYLMIIGILGLIIYIINKIRKFKFNKLEIISFILMILACLSLINAKNLEVALFGRIDRYEGLFVILTYYIFFLISLNIESRKYLKIIVYLIIIYGFFTGLYGLMQTNVIKFFPWIILKNKWLYARGFFGNSIFYGTFMGVCYSFLLGIFLKTRNILKKVLSYLLLLFFTLSFIVSGSMGAFVSIIAIFMIILFEIIKLIYMKEKVDALNHFGSLVLSIFVFVLMFSFLGKMIPSLKNEAKDAFMETSSVTVGRVDDNFGTGRIFIWKNTIDKLKENWLTGVGIDNFYYAFDPPLIDSISNAPVDKAHNEYLQKMLCEGVVSGLIYIVLLLIIFFINIKKYNCSEHYGLFLAFTYYAIQAFFNISITRIAPIFFVIMGLLVSMSRIDSDFDIEIGDK